MRRSFRQGLPSRLVAIFQSSLAGKFSLVLLALLIPLLFVGLSVSRGLSRNADDLLRARRIKELSVSSLSLILTQDDVTKEILLDVDRISEAQRKIDAYDENAEVLEQIAALTDSPEIQATLATLRKLDDEELRPLDSRVLETLIEHGPDVARRLYFEESQPVRFRYIALARQLTEQAEHLAVRAQVDLEARNLRSMLEVAVALVVGIALVAAVTLMITRHVRRRLAIVVGVLERMADGDLRQELEVDSEDEIGRIASALNSALDGMRGALAHANESAHQVQMGGKRIALAAGTLAKTASDQRQEMGQASDSMDEITGQVWEIAETSRALRALVNSSGEAAGEIASISEAFREGSTALTKRVDDTSRAVEDMKVGVEQVDAATDVLARGAESTSSSVLRMAEEMDSVDRIASESAELWQRMVERGEEAREKVQQTAEGVESIRESTRDAAVVVKGVGTQADKIGSILDVINDVADETKLLALNAAIIAANSGERGKAFAVVASEIKTLAQRVTANTNEIEAVIRGVQQESANAIEAMDRSSRGVAVVVGLSSTAGEAVDEITRSSRESGEQIREIARAVQDQTRAAREIVERMQQTNEAIDDIRASVGRSGTTNELLVGAASFMHDAARQIVDTTSELVRCTERISDGIAGVKDASGAVEEALQVQTRSTRSVSEFLEKVGKRSSENSQSAQLTSTATQELSEQADELRDHVLRFKL